MVLPTSASFNPTTAKLSVAALALPQTPTQSQPYGLPALLPAEQKLMPAFTPTFTIASLLAANPTPEGSVPTLPLVLEPQLLQALQKVTSQNKDPETTPQLQADLRHLSELPEGKKVLQALEAGNGYLELISPTELRDARLAPNNPDKGRLNDPKNERQQTLKSFKGLMATTAMIDLATKTPSSRVLINQGQWDKLEDKQKISYLANEVFHLEYNKKLADSITPEMLAAQGLPLTDEASVLKAFQRAYAETLAATGNSPIAVELASAVKQIASQQAIEKPDKALDFAGFYAGLRKEVTSRTGQAATVMGYFLRSAEYNEKESASVGAKPTLGALVQSFVNPKLSELDAKAFNQFELALHTQQKAFKGILSSLRKELEDKAPTGHKETDALLVEQVAVHLKPAKPPVGDKELRQAQRYLAGELLKTPSMSDEERLLAATAYIYNLTHPDKPTVVFMKVN
jgi:hypothetical protein